MELAIFAVVLVVFVLIAVAGVMAARKRREAITAFCQQHGLVFSEERDHSFDDRYPAFACFRRGERNRYAYNTMQGKWRDREFLGFDYHYETTSTDSKGRRSTHHHYFSGVILNVQLPLKALHIRPENFFDKVTEFFGYDDIDFESAEFSRKFHVTSPDRKWAFDVLHQRAMQFLLDQPRFTVQFEGPLVLAIGSGTFKPDEFAAAADTVCGLIDQLPDYVRRQLADSSRSPS